MERAFKGIWIPADIWLDEDLSWPEKLYLAEIESLDKGEGCFASNGYLGKFFQHTRQRASQVVNGLIDKKKLSVWDGERNGKPVRRMKVVDSRFLEKEEKSANIIDGVSNIFDEGVKYICTENTIDNNKDISLEKADADMKKSIRGRFFQLYRLKAKQLTGKSERADGKLISPPWGAKEGSLFKADYESHGPVELRRLMHIFFADQVQAVKEFVKQASYTYPVFHSQIPKLQMFSGKVVEPCSVCGSFGMHYSSCSKIEEKLKAEEASREEIMAAREVFKEIDLMGEVMKKVRKKIE